eukprot:3565677-Pleurochrysis_carterae.AAC.5
MRTPMLPLLPSFPERSISIRAIVLLRLRDVARVTWTSFRDGCGPRMPVMKMGGSDGRHVFHPS